MKFRKKNYHIMLNGPIMRLTPTTTQGSHGTDGLSIQSSNYFNT